MIVEINFFSVFFEVESEYGIGLSLTITIFALEGVAIVFSNPLHSALFKCEKIPFKWFDFFEFVKTRNGLIIKDIFARIKF
jgi:hypothetical protein